MKLFFCLHTDLCDCRHKLFLLTTVNNISRWLTIILSAEFKVKAKNKHHAAIYNHTLATILVEYASAVSSENFIPF